MFWHSAANSNAIDNLLDQPDVTLTKILDQDEVLMEIRGMNKKLLEFLTRPENMNDMLDLITTVPSAEIPIPLQYKYPNTACEVLTSDIGFVEKIAAERPMMEKLYHFFRDAEPPLNPLLASYVCRVLGEMIVRKLDQNWYSYQLNLIQVMGYLQSEPNLMDWMLKHVETSAVCDFFHKLVMSVEGHDMRSSLYEWLENKENFFAKLVTSMGRLFNKEAHMNICRLFGDLLFALQDETSSSSQDRSMDSEPFLLALKSHGTFERLLDVIFGEETLSQSSIVYGLDMILALLGITKKPTKQSLKVDSTYETNEDVTLPNSIRSVLVGKFGTLLRFLQCPPSSCQAMRLSNGILNEPLGMERLAIVKFVAHIITLHDTELNEALIHSGVLGKSLDLLWEFPWNNFLHHYVCQILIQISKITRSSNCAKFILVDYGFHEMMMEAFEKEDLKCGYMGHLAKITASWNDSLEMNEAVTSILPEVNEAKPDFHERFKKFYEEHWKTYHMTSTQLLAGAALPTSGVTMSSSTTNYESDPGVTWDSSSGTGMNADLDNNDFFEASNSSNFGCTDRYDDEKSKAIFEMFCYERSNSAEDGDDDDVSFTGHSDDMIPSSTPYAPETGETNVDLEWSNPEVFLKRLDEQEDLFSQLNLNGGLSDGAPTTFIANPWAGQESVQTDSTDPWAAFDFKEDNSAGGTNDNWANFDQTFPVSSNTEFGDFDNVPDLFQAAPETSPTPTSSAINPSQEESKQSQL